MSGSVARGLMLANAFPRGTRALGGAFVAMLCAGAAAVVLEDAQAVQGEDKLTARLIRLDPGARLGGNTHVAAVPGARMWGVRGRVNFIIGLGARQRIVGGRGHDQLGARRAGTRIHGGRGHDLIHGGRGHQRLHGGAGHDRIHGGAGHDRIHGGAGHDRIHGGRGRDRLEGGPGRNRIIDRQGATVVVAGPGTNHVDVADGSVDRVLCALGSTNRIVIDRADRLHPRCRTKATAVRYRRAPSQAAAAGSPAAHAAQSVSGDGSSANPYVAECTEPQKVICVTPLFAARSLSGLWANEYVPAYQCPPSHPFLYDESYAPAGTSLPHGVGVLGLGPIGVSITGFKTKDVTVNNITSGYTTGTDTGLPNSSATNWELGTNSYQVQLHCTSDTRYAVFLGYL